MTPIFTQYECRRSLTRSGRSRITVRSADCLEAVIHQDNLHRVLELLQVRNGQAPGIDRIRCGDMSRNEWYQYFRDQRNGIQSGTYRPQPTRPVSLPKSNGGTRTLNLPVVADRVVAKAIAIALEARAEARFLPCSYGFRRNKNIFALFADLKRNCETNHAWVLTTDDVRAAFDCVVIAHAMESLHRLALQRPSCLTPRFAA